MESFDLDFLKKLDRLALQGRRIVSGGTGGNRRSKAKGSSIEFSDFREYTLGDDYRSIDWNAYARFERLFVKLYMEERESNITILLDTSASMDFGEPNKGKLAKELAAIFAYIALSNYDRVGIAAINDSVANELPYFSGKPGFTRALNFLDEINFRGNTGLKSGIMSFGPLHGRKGISILISDLLSKESFEETVQYLKYQQQEIVVIQVLSPQEISPELTGSLRLIDTESGEPVEVEITPHTTSLYQKAFREFTDHIKVVCTKLEVSYIQVSSGMSLDEVIFSQLFESGIIR